MDGINFTKPMSDKAISTESLQQEGRTFPPSPEVVKHALINRRFANTDALYQQRSLREPDKFWLEQAQSLEWFKKPTVARKFDWSTDALTKFSTRFFRGRLFS